MSISKSIFIHHRMLNNCENYPSCNITDPQEYNKAMAILEASYHKFSQEFDEIYSPKSKSFIQKVKDFLRL